MDNKLGILCPVASLLSDYGIGDLGKSARRFIDEIMKLLVFSRKREEKPLLFLFYCVTILWLNYRLSALR